MVYENVLKCVNFKFRYLFFNKSRKCVSKHKIASAVHKIFLCFLIALTFDVKVPSKTYYNMESEMRTYHELFTEEYFAIAESTGTNCMKELSLYALSKHKYSKHCWYFQYLLLLSGDINLHTGPIQCPCSVCTRVVRKRVVCCDQGGSKNGRRAFGIFWENYYAREISCFVYNKVRLF